MIARYSKKPVVIEAVQFVDNDSALEIAKWAGTPPVWLDIDPADNLCHAIDIDTLEGTMRARLGDWVIRGVKGEFYPCKPDIFTATYEPAQADARPGRGGLRRRRTA